MVSKGLLDLIEIQKELGGASERLEDLERSRARWEAEMEAMMLKADSTLKSASNAESRSRTMMKHAEKILNPFDDEGEEALEDVGAPILPGDAPPGEEVGLRPLRVGVEAVDRKTQALRLKFA